METSPEPGPGHAPAPGDADPAVRSDPDATTRTVRRGRDATTRTARRDPGADGRAVRSTRRRHTRLVGLGVVAAVTASALVAGLLTWQPDPPAPTRALTVAEAERLAAVRVTNYRDGRAGVRATVGRGGDRVEAVGWVDWTRPLVYLDVGGPGAGPLRGLVQATPDLMAVRPDPAAVLTPAVPPLVPPADNWRIRDLPDRPPVAALLDLLLALAADRPDPVARLPGARWVARDTVGRSPVDVFRMADLPVPPDSPASGTPTRPPPDDGWRYWVDRDARLHRLTARLPDAVPVTLDLDRSHRPPLHPVAALGGARGLPRDLTGEEAERLTAMPARNRALGGTALTLAAPTGTGANLRGGGWLDWRGQVAYLATTDLDAPEQRTLTRHDRSGVARTQVPVGDEAPDARPPLPPPRDARWQRGRTGPGELDLLVGSALRAGREPPDPDRATWLRRDNAGRQPVDVIEVYGGRHALRYWLDRSGVLRRLELRTGTGAWAQLDLVQAPVPRLPPVPRSSTR
ncbi:hypothetical protein [Micromonospora inyonensis]|uniref:Uncharacterized protein n=1 Tax=Micromonospora inyonensis TaxID=47866 RepID=A0A1C6S3G5_9ACTN|nr:hypothetical protein [Micromonospora inyonensis]SCL23971.1 hypothetical protein GA0074694_3800 [Micromonospora inyonensis]